MTYETFNSSCFSTFPSLRDRTTEVFSYMTLDEIGPYLVFEDILISEIDNAAANDPAYLKRLMDFVEEVAMSDEKCVDLVQIGLGEWLPSSGNKDVIRAAASPATEMAIWKAERYFAQWERRQNGSPLSSLLRKIVSPRKKEL